MNPKDLASELTGRCRLLIVDEHALCCAGLKALFRGVWYIVEVATAVGSDEAVRVARRFRPNVVLIDATLPNQGAFQAGRDIRSQRPESRLLFLDDSVRPARVRAALSVGGSGYWTRHATFDEISGAVRLVAAGRNAFCPAVRKHLEETPTGPHFRFPPPGTTQESLTPRQQDVWTLLAGGLSVKQCAKQMGVSESTIDNHKVRLMKKLGVHSTLELVRTAVREGLVDW